MKKIFIAVSVVLTITIIGCVGMIGYHNKYYDIWVQIPTVVEKPGSTAPSMKKFRETGKSYCLIPMFGGGEKASKEQKEYMETVSKDIREFSKEIEQLPKPHFIEAKYENGNNNSKTVITFKGEVTNPETGELEPFEKVFMYPFIITKSIYNIPPEESYYFSE